MINSITIQGVVMFSKKLEFKDNKKLFSFVLKNTTTYTTTQGTESQFDSYIDCEAWGSVCNYMFFNVKDGDFIEIIGNLKTYINNKDEKDEKLPKKTSVNIKHFSLKKKFKKEPENNYNKTEDDGLPF